MASLFLTDQQLRAMNPWWTQPLGWERTDPHLSALAERPIRLGLPFVEALGLDRPGLHTVRGPRQVGK
jgi:hypothetical protein